MVMLWPRDGGCLKWDDATIRGCAAAPQPARVRANIFDASLMSRQERTNMIREWRKLMMRYSWSICANTHLWFLRIPFSDGSLCSDWLRRDPWWSAPPLPQCYCDTYLLAVKTQWLALALVQISSFGFVSDPPMVSSDFFPISHSHFRILCLKNLSGSMSFLIPVELMYKSTI